MVAISTWAKKYEDLSARRKRALKRARKKEQELGRKVTAFAGTFATGAALGALRELSPAAYELRPLGKVGRVIGVAGVVATAAAVAAVATKGATADVAEAVASAALAATGMSAGEYVVQMAKSKTKAKK